MSILQAEPFDAVEFFARNGRTCYRDKIARLTAIAATMTGAERLDVVAEIEHTKMDAADRYDDYRTDPLP